MLRRFFIGLLILISISNIAEAQQNNRERERKTISTDSIQISVDFLKKYFQTTGVWKAENPEILRTVKGLVYFTEYERIDTVLAKLDRFQKIEDFRYINRSPKHVGDSLTVSGYLPYSTVLEKMKQLNRAIWNGVDMKSIPLPEHLKNVKEGDTEIIKPGDEKAIIRLTHLVLPDSLANVHLIPDSVVKTPNDFSRIRQRQQARDQLLELARQKHNAQVRKLNLDSAITAYREYAVRVYSDSLQSHLRDSLKRQNEQLLLEYNDKVVRSVNDSINQFVQNLQRYAQNDSISIWIHSLSGRPAQVWLRNNQRSSNRVYIKNEQNDSLAIRMMNLDKYSLGIAIDDDVTFNRIVQKQRRDYDFQSLISPSQKLDKVQKKYEIVAPWNIGGNGTFGFTQTYLNNWKAGGKSSFSFLSVLKGYANYSDPKLKWENSGELRNGWIRQGGDLNQTQKNDDKLQLTSRLGVSAFKKWYYSAEIDFVTQFFKGYNYPNDSVPISTYMSPAKTLFKLGLDYKPNKNFSLFLSPITAKYVFVRDTALINQKRFGVPSDKRGFWEPGLNADLKYKVDISPRISYETKYRMFLNYQDPLKKVDINWENSVVAQLTDRINLTFMLYLLYDDNVTFDTGKKDGNGKAIFKPKWQTRELMTIGFSYKVNKRVYKQKKLN